MMRAILLACLLCGCGATGADVARQANTVALNVLHGAVQTAAAYEHAKVVAAEAEHDPNQAIADLHTLASNMSIAWKVLDGIKIGLQTVDKGILAEEAARAKDYSALMTQIAISTMKIANALSALGVK